jgi:hypothetical protein
MLILAANVFQGLKIIFSFVVLDGGGSRQLVYGGKSTSNGQHKNEDPKNEQLAFQNEGNKFDRVQYFTAPSSADDVENTIAMSNVVNTYVIEGDSLKELNQRNNEESQIDFEKNVDQEIPNPASDVINCEAKRNAERNNRTVY